MLDNGRLTANQLTQATIKVLSSCGFKVWRQNNGAVFDAKFNGFRKGSSMKGVSDIIGFHKTTGIFIAVEIKIGKDKLSVYQTMFLRDLEKAGGVACVLRTMDDLIELGKKFNHKTWSNKKQNNEHL